MRLEWAARAIEDREGIFLYIAADSLEAATELDELLARQAAILESQPLAGRTGRVPGTRELLAHRHYVLVYNLPSPDHVRILRVLHTAQQWPPMPGKKTRKSGQRTPRRSRS